MRRISHGKMEHTRSLGLRLYRFYRGDMEFYKLYMGYRRVTQGIYRGYTSGLGLRALGLRVVGPRGLGGRGIC